MQDTSEPFSYRGFFLICPAAGRVPLFPAEDDPFCGGLASVGTQHAQVNDVEARAKLRHCQAVPWQHQPRLSGGCFLQMLRTGTLIVGFSSTTLLTP